MLEDVTAVVVRAQHGDRDAFEQLLLAYQKRVFYSILRIVGETHMADDLTQEVFLKVHQALPRLKTPEHFTSWLFRIAMNRAIDSRRQARKTRTVSFLIDDFYSVGSEDPGVSRPRMDVDRLQAEVNEAIATLPPRQKEVLSLTMDQNLSQEEIAQAIHCPVGTVKSRLHHARKYLKERLRRWLDAE